MAEEQEKIEEVPAGEEAPAKKGKGMMLIIILGVVLIAGGTTAGLVLGKRSRPKVPEPKKKTDAPVVSTFQDLYVNIAETKATRVLKLSVVLELSNEKLSSPLESFRPIIRDLICESASHMTIEELEGRNGRGILKREIKNRSNELLRDRMSGAIVQVYFTDFLIQ
jgi:flagellar basal body-associated protein FliL